MQKTSKQERTEASPGTRIKLSHLGVARKYRKRENRTVRHNNNDKKIQKSKVGKKRAQLTPIKATTKEATLLKDRESEKDEL